MIFDSIFEGCIDKDLTSPLSSTWICLTPVSTLQDDYGCGASQGIGRWSYLIARVGIEHTDLLGLFPEPIENTCLDGFLAVE
jgi:hypothetical protein